MRRIFQFFIIIILVLIDQGSKLFFSQRDGVVINYGGVFGLFPGWPWTGLLIVVLLFLVLSLKQTERLVEKWGLGLIVAGGLGNILDRGLIGGVRDFIYWPVIKMWGNVADLWLTIGVGLLVINSIKHSEKE